VIPEYTRGHDEDEDDEGDEEVGGVINLYKGLFYTSFAPNLFS